VWSSRSLPATGWVSSIVVTFSRRPAFGYIALVLSLIATPEEERDLELITFSREQVIRAITTDASPDEPTDIPSRAIALRVALEEDPPLMLSPAERALLAEWLDRVAK